MIKPLFYWKSFKSDFDCPLKSLKIIKYIKSDKLVRVKSEIFFNKSFDYMLFIFFLHSNENMIIDNYVINYMT